MTKLTYLFFQSLYLQASLHIIQDFIKAPVLIPLRDF